MSNKQEKYKAKQRENSARDARRLAQKEKRKRIEKQIEERERAAWQKAREVGAVSIAKDTLEQGSARSTDPTKE